MIYMLLAFFTGIIMVIQMQMNSHISSKIDSYNGVFYNYFTAVFFFTLYFLVKPAIFTEGAALIPAASPWMFFGGLLGIAVVVLCNLSFKALPATLVTSLIILGQLGAAITIDLSMGVDIHMKEIGGMALIISGIIYNSHITERSQRRE